MSNPIITSHPAFVPDQVLTDSHLNQLRDYLDQQGRLTRSMLIGSGIVCGLDVNLTRVDVKTALDCWIVEVCAGYALSSEGYLIHWPATARFESYRPYKPVGLDGRRVVADTTWEGATHPVLELVGPDTPPLRGSARTNSQNEPLSRLTTEVIDCHVVVLYLEKRQDDLKPCVVTDCGSKGDQVHHITRVLLVHQDDLDAIDPCTLAKNPAVRPVSVPRFHTELYDLEGRTIEPIHLDAVETSLQIGYAYGTISLQSIHKLHQNLVALYDEMQAEGWCDLLHLGDHRATLNRVGLIFPEKRDRYEYNQYHYSFVSDLACALDEFLEAYCKLVKHCGRPTGYPCHVMLRRVVDPTDDTGRTYRHVFAPAPARDVFHGERDHARALWQRMMAMIETFDDALVRGFETLRDNDGIRITPSRSPLFPLGRRALPFYYRTLTDEEKPTIIRHYWQPADCCDTDRLQGYSIQAEIERKEGAGAKHPLHFSALKYDFLRIEGHIGRPCHEVVTALCDMQRLHNVSFDVVVLFLPEEGRPGIPPEYSDADGESSFTFSCNPSRLKGGAYHTYIKHFLGMEHLGGVPPGGTLVLICDPFCPGIEDNAVVADFALPHPTLCCLEEERPADEPPRNTVDVIVRVMELVNNQYEPVGGASVELHHVKEGQIGQSMITPAKLSPGQKIGEVIFSRAPLGDYVAYAMKVKDGAVLNARTPATVSLASRSIIVQFAAPKDDGANQVLAVSSLRQDETANTAAPRETRAAPAEILAQRKTLYLDALAALNSAGEFATNRTYNDTLQFVQAGPMTDDLLQKSFTELMGRLKNFAGRSNGPRAVSYHRIIEVVVQQTMDRIVEESPANLSSTWVELLKPEFSAIDNLGVDLARLRLSWNGRVLAVPAAIALDGLLG